MDNTFRIKEGDREPPLTATLVDAQGDPLDLSAASGVQFLMRPTGVPTALVSAAATILGTGAVRYLWSATDTGAAGTFEGEFEVLYANGKKQTVPNHTYIPLKILGDIG